MEKPKAFVSDIKKEEVKKIKELIESYRVIGLADITGFPSPQLQKIRLNLKDKLFIMISKTRLINIALEESKDIIGLEKLKEKLTGVVALLFSKEEPFKLAKLLSKSKSSAPAKVGQIAPKDVMINAGPTSFTPGPLIGEFGAAGLKAGVEGGKIVIKEDKVVVKKGDVITPKIADLLSKFKIEPMEIGLKILALYEDGIIYGGDILSIDYKVYIENLGKAHNEAFSLALETGYVVKETVEHLIKKAEVEAKALETKIPESKEVKKEETPVVKEEKKEVKEEPKEEIKEEKPIEKVEVKEEEGKVEFSKEKKQAENVVDEIIQKAEKGGLRPEEERTKDRKGPSEKEMKKAEDFVKELTGGNIKSEDLEKGAVQLKKEREDKEKEKEKKEKDFKEAEKVAKDILGKV